MQQVVSIKNVSYGYGHSSYSFALENISFSVNRSDVLGITGPDVHEKAGSLDVYLD